MKKKKIVGPRHGPPTLTAAELPRLFELHRLLGCRWRLISRSFPGRSDNQVKNAFFACMRKALRRMARLSANPGATRAVQRVKPRTLSAFMLELMELPCEVPLPEPAPTWLRQRCVAPAELVASFAAPGGGNPPITQLQPALEYLLECLFFLDRGCADVKDAEEQDSMALVDEFCLNLQGVRGTATAGGRLPLAASLARLSQLSGRLSALLGSERQGPELAAQLTRLLGTESLPRGMVSLNSLTRRSSQDGTLLFTCDLAAPRDASEWPGAPSFAGASLFRRSRESTEPGYK